MYDLFNSYTKQCTEVPIYSYVLAMILCIGGILSYIPQYYSLIKHRDKDGVSIMSMLLLNVGSTSLAVNALILNWWKFSCYNYCNGWICTANLLSLFQILINTVVVIPLFLLVSIFKIRNTKNWWNILYFGIYIFYAAILVLVTLLQYHYNEPTLKVTAWGLGAVVSPITSCAVWIPQIIKLIIEKTGGNLSLLMFIFQTPGNAIIIVMQILYHQSWTTWVSYLVTLIEQTIIVILLIVYKRRRRTELIINLDPELSSESDFDENTSG